MKSITSEKQLVEIWQHRFQWRTDLATEDGNIARIIYPGRPNDDRGADLRDAVILVGQELRRGDVEFHLRSSGWQAHGHQQDPAYNRVVLHVVLKHDAGKITVRQNGSTIPVLVLNNQLNSTFARTEDHFSCAAAAAAIPPEKVVTFIQHAGKARFISKATKFHDDIGAMGRNQALYRGIMGALGYPKNKLPFEELSRRMPLHKLASLPHSTPTDREYLARQQALLLGTAGLLPSQSMLPGKKNKFYPGWMEEVEQHWSAYVHDDVMAARDWHMVKVRPHNHPVRRIMAMSFLLLRYRKKGLFTGLFDQIKKALRDNDHRALGEALTPEMACVTDTAISWGPAPLGRARAEIMAINVLLPFTLAWARLAGERKLAKSVLDCYGHYPGLATNTIEKHMVNQLGISRQLIDSAQKQQGLLHIYHTMCTQGECQRCLIGEYREAFRKRAVRLPG